jgi:hypothetical protein
MDAPTSQDRNDQSFWSGALTWAGRLLGRALIGAFAGLVMVALALFIASNYLGFFILEEPATRDPFFQTAVGLGAVVFALLAIVSGGAEIGERAGAAIKGVLAGTAFGVVAGAVLGTLIGAAGGGIPQKAGVALGIFCGGPLGAIFGGMIGGAPRGPWPEPKAKGGAPEDDLS